jgi:hypothetical protein
MEDLFPIIAVALSAVTVGWFVLLMFVVVKKQ